MQTKTNSSENSQRSEVALFILPTPEQRRTMLAEYAEPCDRLVREKECKRITSLSRSTRWLMENEGRFPARKPLGRNSCAWLLSDLLCWVRNPPPVENINTPYGRKLSNKSDKQTHVI